MELSIKIGYEMSEEITRKNLVDMYRNCEYDVSRLEAKSEDRDLEEYEILNLYDSRKNMKALGSVLGYMSLKSELEPFGLEDLAGW